MVLRIYRASQSSLDGQSDINYTKFINKAKFMNFFEFNKQFPTELACIEHFIKIRYRNKPVCKHCSSDKLTHRKDKPKKFQCGSCNNSFSIFKETIFEKSDTDLRKWFYAIHLFLNSKKGISGYQLQREIAVTYKTAWRMLKQIRLAMGNVENQEFLGTLIEVDEMYVERGRGTKKNVVVGFVDRNNKDRECMFNLLVKQPIL